MRAAAFELSKCDEHNQPRRSALGTPVRAWENGQMSSSLQLTEGHLNLLEEVYRVLRDHAKWPTFGYLERFLDTRFDTDIEELMETLPHRLTTLPPGRYPVGEQWEVKLTIEGLRYVELPGAAEDVELSSECSARWLFRRRPSTLP
jgi:hypothetical protein